MVKKLAAIACLVALVSCSTYDSIQKEDLVVAPHDRIPLKLGVLNVQTSHLGTQGIYIANEDRGIVLEQALDRFRPVFDRVSDNPRLADTDVLVGFDYTTKLSKSTATCYGIVTFINAQTREPVAEIKTKTFYEGLPTDRQGVIRYNAVLKALRQMASEVGGNAQLRKYARSLGRTVVVSTVPQTQKTPAAKCVP